MARPWLALALAFPVVAALHATGCKHKERYERDTVTPVQADPSIGVTIDATGPVVAKPSNGDLQVPLRVHNSRGETLRVLGARCEVECTNGTRCRSRDDAALFVNPDATKDFSLLFGDRGTPVVGSSFRVYLWIERTNGKGLLEFVPPLVIKGGSEPFAYPPRSFQKDPGTGKSVDDAFPPVAPRPSATPAPTAGAPDTKPCPACGEARPVGSARCPQCGSP